MPIQTFNFANLAIVRDEENALAKLFPSVVEGYYQGKQEKIGREAAERQKQAEELAHSFMQTYGPRLQEAKIKSLEMGALSPFGALLRERGMATSPQDIAAYDQMINSQSMGGGRGGITPGMRAFSALPAAARENMLAQMRPLTPHMNDVERINLLNHGASLESIREQAAANGIDVENVEPILSPTTANVTKLKNQEGASAELDFLEQKTAGPMSQYSRKVFGYSPAQVIDAISGKNPEEQAEFLAARALQPEIAGARQLISGGSTAMEAMHRAQADALGYVKIFEGLVDPEVAHLAQKKINNWLQEGFVIRKKTIQNIPVKQTQSVFDEYSKTVPYSVEELLRMREGAE